MALSTKAIIEDPVVSGVYYIKPPRHTWFMTLEGEDVDTVAIGPGDWGDGFNATSDGIDGWYDTPDPKWELTEGLTVDGAFVVPQDEVLYSAKTVEVHLYVQGAERWELLNNALKLKALAGREVTATLFDDGLESSLEGYAYVDFEEGPISNERMEATLTLEVPDPDLQCLTVALRTETMVQSGSNATSFAGTLSCGVSGELWPLVHLEDLSGTYDGSVEVAFLKGDEVATFAIPEFPGDVWVQGIENEGPFIEAWSGWDKGDVELEDVKVDQDGMPYADGDQYGMTLNTESGAKIAMDTWFRPPDPSEVV